jgi:hypothetical protein
MSTNSSSAKQRAGRVHGHRMPLASALFWSLCILRLTACPICALRIESYLASWRNWRPFWRKARSSVNFFAYQLVTVQRVLLLKLLLFLRPHHYHLQK